MKVLTKVLTVVLAVTLLCFVFASCAETLSGTYTGEVNFGIGKASAEYKFSGSKVTITYEGGLFGFSGSHELEGTYEINEKEDGSKTMTITISTDDSNASKFSGTHSYEKGDGYIKLDGIQYNKK